MVLGFRVRSEPEAEAEDPADAAPEEPRERPARGSTVIYRDVLWIGHLVVWAIFTVAVPSVVWAIRFVLREIGRLLLGLLSPALNLFQRSFEAIERAYPRVLESSLNNKPLVFATVLGLVALSALLYGRLGGELIPPLSQGEFAFQIEFPEGTPLDATDRIFQRIEKEVAAIEDVQTVFSSVGGSNENQFSQSALEENAGRIHILMEDRRDRPAEEQAITRIRAVLAEYPDVNYTFERPTLFSFKTPIEIEIYAFDLEGQQRAADQVVARLGRIDGLSDIQTTTKLGSPEIQIRFDRARLARLGLDETRIGEILRNKIRGEVASRYREEEKQIEILVRADEEHRGTIADLKNLVINDRGNNNARGQTGQTVQNNRQGQQTGPTGSVSANTGANANNNRNQQGESEQNEQPTAVTIRLGAVADIQIARGPAEVRRIRSQRAAIVSANLSGRDLNSVSDDIRAALQELRGELPVNTVVGLAGQNAEAERSFQSLQFALGLAIFLVYLVMASQFESLTHPFVILFTVPLALVGVVLSLFVTQTSMSVMVFLGVIVLAGIVVNNAIILVDFTNQLRRQGIAKREAILRAGKVRLRPIVMTTLTTVLGLFPMALGWGEGSEMRAPMAVAVMGGLAFSTLLTLVLIPVVYDFVDRGAPAVSELDAADDGIEPEPGPEPTMEQSWDALRDEGR